MINSFCRYLFAAFLIATLSSCSTSSETTSSPKIEFEVIQKQIRSEISILESFDKQKLLKDMAAFRAVLKKRPKKLSLSEQALHDSLLKTYIKLKSTPREGSVLVPAHSVVKVPLQSFCLDSSKAPPVIDEVYQWKRNRNQPHVQKILKLAAEKKLSRNELQGLIWKIQKQTSLANVADLLLSEIQIPNEGADAIGAVKDGYEDFQEIQSALEKRQSQQAPPSQKLQRIEGTDLISSSDFDGYSAQTLSLFNRSDSPITFPFSEYVQWPLRTDVQPIASYFESDPDLAELFNQLEKLLFDDMLPLGLGFTPVLGDLIDLFEFSTGRNFFNGDWLTDEQRFMSAMALLAGSGAEYRYAEKIANAPIRYIRESQNGYRAVKNTKSYEGLAELVQKVETKGIPDEWRVKVTKPQKDGQGIEFVHPDNKHTRIRLMPGKAQW